MSKKANPIEEFKDVFLAYLRQETVRPLKALLSWAFLGLLGSIFVTIGFIFLTVGGIRVLQNETGSIFDGSLSWAPYLLSTLGLLFLSLIGIKIIKGKKTDG